MLDVVVSPFWIQIAVRPSAPDVLRQKRSALPSPSKSPMPAIFQFVSATEVISEFVVIVAPFMKYIAFAPVLPLRQTRSPLRSPLKSCGVFATAVVQPPPSEQG